MTRRKSHEDRHPDTRGARATLVGPPFRPIVAMPLDESPTIVDPPGTRAGSTLDEEATTRPTAAHKDRVTPYGQSLPSLDEVKNRLVAAIMVWARIYSIDSPVLEPTITAIRAEFKKRGIELPKDERIVRQRLNENEALIARILEDVERLGISPDGILLPSIEEVRAMYRQMYENFTMLPRLARDPESERLLGWIAGEARKLYLGTAMCGSLEAARDEAIYRALEKAAEERIPEEPAPDIPKPSKRRGTAPETAGSFVNVRLTGKMLALAAAAIVTSSVLKIAILDRPWNDGTWPPTIGIHDSHTGESERESYRKAIFPYGDGQEGSVIVAAGQAVKSKGSLHLSQVFDIYDWMGSAISYLSVMESGRPRPAGITLAAGEGDCKNMAVLFASMATSIGARTAIALVPGHAYNLVRVATSDNKDGYDTVKEEIQTMVRQRYGILIPPSQDLEFFENKEGLWLSFDATAGKKGYPGLAELRKPILEILAFGSTELPMKLR